ncbi:MAG: hypothetical protein LBL84_03340 [Candidatus Nomurabacteria bacterium]|jgi:uncharacterized membrane protein YeiH|nr:hypothetical protein [Candidatus Nomurabacteria bacterium]
MLLYLSFLGQSALACLVIVAMAIVFLAFTGRPDSIREMTDRQFKRLLIVTDTLFTVAFFIAGVRYGLLPEHDFLLTMLGVFAPVFIGAAVLNRIVDPGSFSEFMSRPLEIVKKIQDYLPK